jgi:hypothetical protein
VYILQLAGSSQFAILKVRYWRIFGVVHEYSAVTKSFIDYRAHRNFLMPNRMFIFLYVEPNSPVEYGVPPLGVLFHRGFFQAGC